MPQVSRNQLDQYILDELCSNFDLVISKLDKLENAATFFRSFLTPTERIMLAKRLSLIILLKENLPQTQIAQILNVTQATVSRMQLVIDSRGSDFDIIFKVLKKDKSSKDLKENLLKLVAYTARAAGGRVKPGMF